MRDLGPLERQTKNHLCSTALKDYHFLASFERDNFDFSEVMSGDNRPSVAEMPIEIDDQSLRSKDKSSARRMVDRKLQSMKIDESAT